MEEAAVFGKESLDYFGKRGRWAGARDEIARAMMFSNKYADAAEVGRYAWLWSQV